MILGFHRHYDERAKDVMMYLYTGSRSSLEAHETVSTLLLTMANAGPGFFEHLQGPVSSWGNGNNSPEVLGLFQVTK
jgi:hypothetical protein